MCWKGCLHSSVCFTAREAWTILILVFALQGVNPWIEVDGGVGPKNAYKVSLSLSLLWSCLYFGKDALVTQRMTPPFPPAPSPLLKEKQDLSRAYW